MNILKVVGNSDEPAFSTTHNSLILGQQQYPFLAVCENSLTGLLLQNLSASTVLIGNNKLASLKEIFSQFALLESTVFVSACEVKRDGAADLFHMSSLKNYGLSIPFERQLKKVKLTEAIVRLVAKRHANSAYGILSCLIVNFYKDGAVTSIVDLNTRVFFETFKGSAYPMVQKLLFRPNSTFVLHLDKHADTKAVSAAMEEFSETQTLFSKKHKLFASNSAPVQREVRRLVLPNYARPTVSSRKPAQKFASKEIGKKRVLSTQPRDNTRTHLKESAVQGVRRDLPPAKQNLDQILQRNQGGSLAEMLRIVAEQGAKISEQAAAISEQRAKISEQSAKISEQSVAIEDWQSRASQETELKAQLEAADKELKASLKETEILTSQNKLVENSYKETLEKLHALEETQAGNATMLAECDILKQTNSIQDKNLNKLTSILEEKETLIVELRGFQSKYEGLEAQLAAAENTIKENDKLFERTLKDYETKVNAFEMKIKDSEKKMKDFEKSDQNTRQGMAKYQTKISELQSEIEANKITLNERQSLIDMHTEKEVRYEAKIAELNDIISKSASFEYPELDFTKIHYPLTHSPTMDFTEFGNENDGAFKKPAQLRSSSPLRAADTNTRSRFEPKLMMAESNLRSLPKPHDDLTHH